MKNILLKIRESLFSKKSEDAEKKIEEVLETITVSVDYTNKVDIEQFTEEEKKLGYDEVHLARQSNDLEKMLKATELGTTLSNRHFLLQSIVSESYSLRKDEEYKTLCEKFSEIHLKEFEQIFKTLKEEFKGFTPVVKTFQYYATLLTEKEEFEKAIKVCELAISYGLEDGTKGCYEGRISRIYKKMNAVDNKKSIKTSTKKNSLPETEYNEGQIKTLIRDIVREAQNTAKVDTGYLKRSISGNWVANNNRIEFEQIFYGAKNGNSRLLEIAKSTIPSDVNWSVILFDDFGNNIFVSDRNL